MAAAGSVPRVSTAVTRVAAAAEPGGGAARAGRRWMPVVVALGSLLALWRGWDRLTEPAFWGEDGSVFVKAAREDGVCSLLRTYAGCLHLLPRLAALGLRPLPLGWQPGLYAAVGLAAGAAVCALALSDRLAWLLPAPWQRMVLFAALLVAPGRDEVTGNLANLIFLAPVGLLLLGLCRDPAGRRGRWAELGGAAVLGLGGVLALMVVPVFAARAARLRSRHSSLLAVLVTATGVLQTGLLLADPRAGDRTGSPGVVVSFLHHRLLPAWLVGDTGWQQAWARHPILLALGCAALVVLLVAAALAVPSRPTAVALLGTLLLASVAAGLAYRRLWHLPVAQRHLVLPLAVVTVLVVGALGARPAVLRAAAGVALLASLVLAVPADWRLTRWPALPVGPTAACLAEGPAPCPLPVNATPHPVILTR